MGVPTKYFGAEMAASFVRKTATAKAIARMTEQRPRIAALIRTFHISISLKQNVARENMICSKIIKSVKEQIQKFQRQKIQTLMKQIMEECCSIHGGSWPLQL